MITGRMTKWTSTRSSYLLVILRGSLTQLMEDSRALEFLKYVLRYLRATTKSDDVIEQDEDGKRTQRTKKRWQTRLLSEIATDESWSMEFENVSRSFDPGSSMIPQST